jgi:alanine-glyoxylate transaminase/serine-glyoxylate transaminase/serine-pyruvate transaminase
MYETGQFAALWARLAKRLGLSPEILEWQGDDSDLPEAPGWRHGVQAR